LIKAVEILKRKHPNVCLGIIGGGPESKALKQIAFDLKIEDNVKFLGEISRHEDVIGIIKKSEIFVSASEREGYGQSVLEALYLGLNVIVVDNPNNAAAEFVGKYTNGIVLKENNPLLYASTIDKLLTKQILPASSFFESDSETMSSRYLYEWLGLLK
jgi:glycosyltransferase involved in cell wall biosynthesis